MQLHGKLSPFAKMTTGPVRTRTTSGGTRSSGGGGGGGSASGYLGPFPAYKGCPAGTIVAHRYGSGLDKMVQCKSLSSPAPVVQAPQPAPISNVFTPTVTVSPNIQTEVSPQISPVFQQTGQGDQSAGTSMVSPSGQGSRGGDPRTLEQIIQAALSEQKEKDYRARIAREERDQETKRISDEKNKLTELENLARAQQEAQRQADIEAQRAAQFEVERQRVEIERAEQAAQKDAEILASRASVPAPMQTVIPSGGGSAYAPGYGSPFTRNGAPSTSERTTEKVTEEKSGLTPLIIAGSVLLIGGAYYFIEKG